MPKWLTAAEIEEIRAVYAEAVRLTTTTGIVHHVDHFIPLVVKDFACGLHTPLNLRPLIGVENNRRPRTYIDFDEIEASHMRWLVERGLAMHPS